MNLHARLDARHPVLQVFAPHRRRGAEDLDGLLLRHEDAHVARDARHRGKAAADLDGIALTAFLQHAHQ